MVSRRRKYRLVKYRLVVESEWVKTRAEGRGPALAAVGMAEMVAQESGNRTLAPAGKVIVSVPYQFVAVCRPSGAQSGSQGVP